MSFINSILNDVKNILESKIEVTNGLATNKTVGDDFRPSDINIEAINLISADGERTEDLIPYVTRMDIFESIYSPVIYAELQIQDSVGLDQNFPLIGEEFIVISFATPGSESTTYGFSNRGLPVNKKNNNNLKGSTYTLKLVSADAIKNLTASSMNNKGEFVPKIVKDNVTGIVKDILKDDLKVSVPISVINTKGVFEEKIIYGIADAAQPPNTLSPFRYIDYFRKILASSAQYESQAFNFFLNKNGYFFTTKEKLIEQGVKSLDRNQSDKRFFFDVSRNSDNRNVRMRDILAYNHINNGSDVLDYISDSGFAGSATSFDPLTFEVKTITYTDNLGADKFQKTDHNAGNQFTSRFTKMFGQTVTNSRLVAERADLPNRGLAEKIIKTQAFAAKMSLNELHIEVYGDTELTVGDVIECTLPSSISADDVKDEMRLHSGNYLISALRHIILNGGRPQHVISMALEKNGLVE